MKSQKTPPEPSKKDFDDLLKCMLSMPIEPHKTSTKSSAKKTAKKKTAK